MTPANIDRELTEAKLELRDEDLERVVGGINVTGGTRVLTGGDSSESSLAAIGTKGGA